MEKQARETAEIIRLHKLPQPTWAVGKADNYRIGVEVLRIAATT